MNIIVDVIFTMNVLIDILSIEAPVAATHEALRSDAHIVATLATDWPSPVMNLKVATLLLLKKMILLMNLMKTQCVKILLTRRRIVATTRMRIPSARLVKAIFKKRW